MSPALAPAPNPREGSLSRLVSWIARPLTRALFVVALAFVTFFGTGGFGTGGFTGGGGRSLSSDTAVYATVGREMVERGDWTRLTVDGEPYVNKPPLVFWCEAAAMSVMGFTEAAARLPSRLFGLATVALLVLLVGRTRGRRAAFWAGLVLVTWTTFQRSASTARLDSALSFWTLGTLGCFLSIAARGLSLGKAAGLGACLGLAILAKGPAGLLAAVALALGAPLAGRGRLLLRAAAVAVPVALLVAGPWYALQWAREGSAFYERLSSDLARDNEKTGSVFSVIAFYATDVFLLGVVWLPALVAGVVLAARRSRRSLVDALLLAFLVVHLLGVATRSVHYSRYFVPAIPVFAWLAATWIPAALRRSRFARARRADRIAAGIVALVVLVGWPVAIATDLFPSRDRYRTIAESVAVVRGANPNAPSPLPLPTTSLDKGAARAGQEPRTDIGSVRAAVRFYFGATLVPWRKDDPAQPPFVLLRHPEADPTNARTAFEATHPLVPVVSGRDYTLYRTR